MFVVFFYGFLFCVCVVVGFSGCNFFCGTYGNNFCDQSIQKFAVVLTVMKRDTLVFRVARK